MWIARTIDELRRDRAALTGRVALVPTMGALHEGHLEHITQCRHLADHVVVSIFVNPTQFGPHEDFEQYPRSLDRDVAMCAQRGATGVFSPTTAEMYPPDVPATAVDVPALAEGLEGRWRPGHFAGVCRVVLKLLHIVQPDYASFGRKDYQQLRVVEAMVRDLSMPIGIVEVPTIREADGLAMSSRNRYLSDEQRRRALGLVKALRQAETLVARDGESEPEAVEAAMRAVLEAHQLEVQYAVVRHPRSLVELDCLEPALTGGVIALVAAKLGEVRLIDNMLLGGDAS